MRRGRRRRARVTAEPAAHRRAHGGGHRRRARAVGARRPAGVGAGRLRAARRRPGLARRCPTGAWSSPTACGRACDRVGTPIATEGTLMTRNRWRSTCTTPDLTGAAARRRPGRADRRAEVAAAEVVLRRPGQRAVRGDHPAAGVLPDPGRAGDPRRARRRDRRRRPAPKTLVELGSGSSEKTRLLLDAFARHGRAGHVRAAGRVASRRCASPPRAIAADYPGLRVRGIVGDFTRHLDRLPTRRRRGWWPSSAAPSATCCRPSGPRSSPTMRAVAGAGRVAAARHRPGQGPGGAGRRPTTTPPGVTAEFNRNVLRVLNRELGADFDRRRVRPRRAAGTPSTSGSRCGCGRPAR